ncbi:tyrosine-type recombinase/integrase [Salinisphaera japonica]|uniref:Integrase n=1 Tax=Salinisphaera japonica YTM-1 TaxID=1209778 RepID=A0A423PJ53_9GAMM|nr:tyrosine-type recombinase/integrase [Salinisphaera japonica]ROO25621.1 integrase [Salinisphaera japonica YTM-1]
MDIVARYEIDKAGVRKKLPPRREPYWGAPLDRGLYLGFRKLAAGGTWIARLHSEGAKHRHKSLGYSDAITHDQAVKAARAWARSLEAGVDTTRIKTVSDACRDYVKDRRREKGESNVADTAGRFRRTVYGDPIGEIELSKLRTAHVKNWRAALNMQPGSANRYLSALKAALNYAVASRYVDGGQAIEWKTVRPATVTTRRDLYLDRGQRRRLIEALAAHAQPFVRGISLLPLRPGALAACTVADLQGSSLVIQHDKVASGRTIALSTDAKRLLDEQAKEKANDEPLVGYTDGSAWTRFRWRDVIQKAVVETDLPRETCAYTFRHSVITDMLIGGIDTMTVARMAGTSLSMIEKHYGHLLQQHAMDAMTKLRL